MTFVLIPTPARNRNTQNEPKQQPLQVV